MRLASFFGAFGEDLSCLNQKLEAKSFAQPNHRATHGNLQKIASDNVSVAQNFVFNLTFR